MNMKQMNEDMKKTKKELKTAQNFGISAEDISIPTVKPASMKYQLHSLVSPAPVNKETLGLNTTTTILRPASSAPITALVLNKHDGRSISFLVDSAGYEAGKEAPKERPVVFFFHGMAGFMDMFVPPKPVEGYTLVIPDRAGYGGTSAPTNRDTWSYKQFAEDIIEAIQIP